MFPPQETKEEKGLVLVLFVIGRWLDEAIAAEAAAVEQVGSSDAVGCVGSVPGRGALIPTTVWFCQWVAQVPILCSQRLGATYPAARGYQVLWQTRRVLEGGASPIQCTGWG